ncbi:MAG: hypothetical protein JXR69_00435 [Candidatus Delongbacteria bacterium]|nr:hypothetical protein [Candidatus Delongbacteria bacterium]
MRTDRRLYKRGNGAHVLKKRFSILSSLIVIMPVVVVIIAYVYKNQGIKSISMKLNELNSTKIQLIEEYERLCSDYEKMNSFIEVKNYAENNLGMKQSTNNLGYFVVYDNRSIFKNNDISNLPKLFESSVDLAMIKTDNIYHNPE